MDCAKASVQNRKFKKWLLLSNLWLYLLCLKRKRKEEIKEGRGHR